MGLITMRLLTRIKTKLDQRNIDADPLSLQYDPITKCVTIAYDDLVVYEGDPASVDVGALMWVFEPIASIMESNSHLESSVLSALIRRLSSPSDVGYYIHPGHCLVSPETAKRIHDVLLRVGFYYDTDGSGSIWVDEYVVTMFSKRTTVTRKHVAALTTSILQLINQEVSVASKRKSTNCAKAAVRRVFAC